MPCADRRPASFLIGGSFDITGFQNTGQREAFPSMWRGAEQGRRSSPASMWSTQDERGHRQMNVGGACVALAGGSASRSPAVRDPRFQVCGPPPRGEGDAPVVCLRPGPHGRARTRRMRSGGAAGAPCSTSAPRCVCWRSSWPRRPAQARPATCWARTGSWTSPTSWRSS